MNITAPSTASTAPSAASSAVETTEDGDHNLEVAPRLVLGFWVPENDNGVRSKDAAAGLTVARTDGYDFVTTLIPSINSYSLVNSNNNTQTRKRLMVPTIRSDVTALESKWWRTSVVGVVDTTTAAATASTSNNSAGYYDYATTFSAALEWSLHMNLPAVLLPPLPLPAQNIPLYASALNLSSLRDQQLWIPVTLQNDTAASDAFDVFHRLVNYHPSIHVVLMFEALFTTTAGVNIPAAEIKIHLADWLRRLHLWIGRVHIAAVALPTSIFLTNRRGFPTLSKAHQVLLTAVLRRIGRTVKLLVQPSSSPSQQQLLSSLTAEQLGESGTLPYQQYLQHFRTSRIEITQVLDSAAAQMELDYLDSLQAPLQPLADHLEFQTYEVFEQDPVKYAKYQEAIVRALRDYSDTITTTTTTTTMMTTTTVAANSATTNASDAATTATAMDTTEEGELPPLSSSISRTYIILVVGAGRGPLVTSCLLAYQQLSNPSFQLQIFAAEKNPSAVLYLNSKLQQDWKNAPVQVVHSDLRELNAQDLFGNNDDVDVGPAARMTTANLVVSELLGSFGCNELSPECLDALFNETDVCGPETLSIPARYTSHAAPISSLKLYQAVKQQALYPVVTDGTVAAIIGHVKAMETPYVVRTHAASQTHPSVDCWSFEHPSSSSPTTTTMMTTPNDTASASPFSRADGVRDRYVHLSFPAATDPTYATATGSGYGAVDETAASVLGSLSSSSNATTAATTALSSGSGSGAALAPLPWTCTGILGTFTADLYGGVTQISTAPHSFSVGMFSWFPLYFPISPPVLVPAGATVHVDLWRKCRDNKVWYEWSIQVVRDHNGGNHNDTTTTTPELLYASPIHNPGGRSYSVSMM